MKKRTLSFLLALVMCLSLLPMTALAAGTPDPAKFDAPIIADLAITEPDDSGSVGISFTLKNPDSIKAALAWYEADDYELGWIQAIIGQVSIDGGEWEDVDITNGDDTYEGTRETNRVNELHIDSQVKFRAYYVGRHEGYEMGWKGSELGKYSNVLTLNEKVDINASDWAQTFIQQADELGLIPEVLEGADMTQDINRLEFAAVCVKVYEALGNTTALPAINNPFKDTDDVEVLKAYNAGVTAGTGDGTTFEPNKLLNRQEMSTMLTNTYKRVTIAGWQAGVDYNHLLGYESYMASNPFADHDHIDIWARPSVYFMAKYGIVGGMGDNKFGPKNVTTEEQAIGFANATREQALTIAVAMVKNFG